MEKYQFFKKIIFCMMLSIFIAASQITRPVFAEEAGSKIMQIKEAGKIVVGTSADYPPYEFHLLNDPDGELVGIDIDIAKVIAAELGVQLEIKDIIFSRLFDELEAGHIDIIIAGLHPKPERKKRADFSDIYYQAIQAIVITSANAKKIKTIEDLRGKTVGVQKDTIQEDMARSYIEGATFLVRETIEELIINLQKGLVDALILEKPVAESYVQSGKNFIIITSKEFLDEMGSAIAVRKTDTDLLAEINRILRKLKEENKIAEFVENAKMHTNKR
ncbi:MAG TPA: transporter substrate-binding domain-containing protein [Candidatus Kapabacteria bacterium]|nr:transporter substrate-binding domain-containing protein [Candidatus Kapabacteria bacterium]